AGDGDRRDVTAAALLPLDLPPHRHLAELTAQPRGPRPDPAAVGLDLRLARSPGADPAASGDPPARLPGQRLAPATEPGQQVFQLGQLDLRLALLAPGVLGEDVQDQRGPVDDL